MRVGPVVVCVAVVLAGAGDGRVRLDNQTLRGLEAPAAASTRTAGYIGSAIDATPARCGTGWRHPRPGRQALAIGNSGARAVEAQLVDPSGRVYGELEGIGPGTVRRLPVTLAPGARYALRCLDDGPVDPVVGPAVRIPSSRSTSSSSSRSASGSAAHASPGIRPVTQQELYGPLAAYTRDVTAGLKTLQAEVDGLRTAVRSGDRAAARKAWLPAHLAYERLGAAYGAFGDRGDAIDGLPAGLPFGTRDPGFTGFHRLELGLWRGQPMSALRPYADRLTRDVASLRREFANTRIDTFDLPLRAHEILEDTLRLQLTGAADLGSGTSLRTAAANLAGTRAVLSVLRPVLRTRYAGMPALDARLDRLDTLLRGRSDLRALSPRERRELDGVVGDLVERLASVATICMPRRSS